MDTKLTKPELFYCLHQLLKKWDFDVMTGANDPQDPRLPRGYRMAYPPVLNEAGTTVVGLRRPTGEVVPIPNMTFDQIEEAARKEVPWAVERATLTTRAFKENTPIPT